MTNQAPEALLQRLRGGHRFVLTSHTSPDGDAIGSELGLARILRALGKGVTIWNRDAVPALYAPLAGAERIHVGSEPPAGFPDQFDTWVALECPTPDRTGIESALAALPIVNIDHHLGNSHYGVVNWIDTSAPSLGEMIHRVAQGLHHALDAETATSLYLTLVTDTGGFRFSNATPLAFEAAAALVREGARPEQVAEWLYESQPAPALRLLGAMLGTLEIHDGGRVASVILTPAMFAAAGAAPGDSEGLVNYPRSIAGVQTVALVKGLGDGRCKVSLRSRGALDVEAIARRHGGGGPKNAAGCVVAGAEEGVRRQMAAALAEALQA